MAAGYVWPTGFRATVFINDSGCIEVVIFVDDVAISSYVFSQTPAEMRAEREQYAHAATTPANLHYWPQQED